MNKLHSSLSIAAILAASALALQAPIAGAADNTVGKPGVQGVELNVGNNASDRGLPGVEMNIGRDGDQNNVDIGRNGDQRNIDTGTLGAGADNRGSGNGSMVRPQRVDRG